jgi:hypothetical protein
MAGICSSAAPGTVLGVGAILPSAGHRGHDVRAVELRGRDRPPGRIWYRIRDYVEDVGQATVEFSSPPVFMDHAVGA